MTWSLANAETRATAHASFRIPPRAEREDLRVGNFAKLVFVDLTSGVPSGERMWVEVVATAMLWGGPYRGRLRNVPILVQDLREGDLVEFGPEHVADWKESGA